ncbi:MULTISPECIES: hypothetical protein [Gallibacterium]|uniref:Uncharacterized protein n=1 Tax=Gallibacterium anatis TaxID=750 RepID=A0A1A7P720_9PAST|nr:MULTISPECIES: hypothetical protein [Gallibacterium]MDA3977595.1 hypothetical protein [Gallibacterium sp. AGMB14963]OBW95814.1 hypothetical protein QV02_04785 [Gallibacterium anatis]OBW98267.1 hypothetical protein QV03_07740 [Gallibacterium anatis]
MSQELSLFIILSLDVLGIVIILAFHKNKQFKKFDKFKAIIRNSLDKGYFTENALELYVDCVSLKYEQALPILYELIIELEQEDYHQDKLTLFRKAVEIYQKTGFLSNLHESIRFKMRALAKQNEQTNEIVFQLAKDIQLLHLTDKFWKRIGIVVSIISILIAFWKNLPMISQYLSSIF